MGLRETEREWLSSSAASERNGLAQNAIFASEDKLIWLSSPVGKKHFTFAFQK